MRLPSLFTLIKVAAGTSIVVSATGYGMRNYIIYGISSNECYTKGLKMIRDHKGIAAYMGEPIIDYKFDLDDRSKNYITPEKAKFEIPIKGSARRGMVYLWASRPDGSEKSPWNIDRLELGVEGVQNQRILVHSLPDWKETR